MTQARLTPEEVQELGELCHLMHVAYAENTGMQGPWLPWERLSEERRNFYIGITLRAAGSRRDAAMKPNHERLCNDQEIARRNRVENTKRAAWNEHEIMIGQAADRQLEIINGALTRAGML